VSAILGFFTALPQLLSLINQLMTFLGPNPGARIAQIGNAFDLLNQAKTPEDKTAAAKAIADSLAAL
jgi:hypothetical protein